MREQAVLIGRAIVSETSLYRLVYALGVRETNKIIREIAERPEFVPAIYDIEEKIFFSAVEVLGIIEEDAPSGQPDPDTAIV